MFGGGLVALCCVAACGAPSEESEAPPRSAAEFLSPSLEGALDRVAERLSTRGFRPRGDRARGFLVEGGAASTSLPLQAGECTIVVVETSEALQEVVLRVHGADGAELSRNTGDDNHGALRYCPPNAGTYYVVSAARRGSGLYSLATFRGPNGIDMDLDSLFPVSAAASAEP